MTTSTMDSETGRPSRWAEAVELFRQGRFAQARAVLEEDLVEQPGHVPSLFGLAVCLVKLGETDQAEPLLRQVINREPAHVSAHVELGRLLARSGHSREAVRLFERVLALAPEHEEALRWITTLTARMSRDEVAGAGSGGGRDDEALSARSGLVALAKELDKGSDAPAGPGGVLWQGKRRLLSHRRLWGGIGCLIVSLGAAVGAPHVADAAVAWFTGQPGLGETVRMVTVRLGYGLLVFGLVLIVGALLSSWLTRYVVRERRLDISSGVLFRKRRAVWLYNFNEVRFDQDPLLQVANTARLTLALTDPGGTPVSPPAGASSPVIVGFGSAKFCRFLQEELQPIMTCERRAMKDKFT